MSPERLLLACALLAPGACCGSFVATAVVRGERGEQVMAGRSRCDQCHTPLPFHQTVPLASYLFNRGACANCGGAIDPLHLIGEIGGAVVAASLVLVDLSGPHAWAQPLLLAGLGFVLLWLGLHDLRTLRLPDRPIGCILALAAALAWRDGELGAGLLAGVATFILLELIRRGFLTLRGEPGLGFGDVKLLAVLAVWLGPQTPWALVLACVLALLARGATRTLQGRAPFGPALACAAWITGCVSAGAMSWSG